MHMSKNFKELIKNLNIPQLNDEEQSFLEKDLTINELREAFTSFVDNKSPGRTVLQRNFIKHFLIFSATTFLIIIMKLSAKIHHLYHRNEEQ